jgi:hypothetical protein
MSVSSIQRAVHLAAGFVDDGKGGFSAPANAPAGWRPAPVNILLNRDGLLIHSNEKGVGGAVAQPASTAVVSVPYDVAVQRILDGHATLV